MHRISSEGSLHVFTYREGLLAAVGHDLRLSVRRFEISFDEHQVQATFFADSVAVDGAMRPSGELDRTAISAKDLREISDNIFGAKVLNVARHPQIRFMGELTAAAACAAPRPGALATLERPAARGPQLTAAASAEAHGELGAGQVTRRVAGRLELCGRTGSLALEVRRADGRLRGEVVFAPSRFGIRPFKALLGTLKIQDRVRVVLDLPDP